MKQDWSTEEVIKHFTLLPIEIQFLGSNNAHNQLGKAILLTDVTQPNEWAAKYLRFETQIVRHSRIA